MCGVHVYMNEIFVMNESLQIHQILNSFKTMPSKPYMLSSLKTLLTTVNHINDKKYFSKFHTKPPFQDNYMKHFISFFQDHFVIIRLPTVAWVLCQVTHKSIHFKSIL